jgi:tRNA U34 5-carboxymethylaminomethyl modifying enzyme MnmG/GidA
LIKKEGPASEIFKLFHCLEFTETLRQQARNMLQEKCALSQQLSSRALLAIHAEIKYDGYIDKERREVEKVQRFQNLKIPVHFSYKDIPGLSKELQQKLSFYKPNSISQAQLIPGMTPAAISILVFQVRIAEKQDVRS